MSHTTWIARVTPSRAIITAWALFDPGKPCDATVVA